MIGFRSIVNDGDKCGMSARDAINLLTQTGIKIVFADKIKKFAPEWDGGINDRRS